MVGICTNRDVGAPSAVPGARLARPCRSALFDGQSMRGRWCGAAAFLFLRIDGAPSGKGAGLIVASVTR